MDIIFVFEVHQPFRLNRDFFWKRMSFQRVKKKELFNYYFDESLNEEIFNRICEKCYIPMNNLLLKLINKYQNKRNPPKFAFSISGIFLEMCEKFNKPLLQSFKDLSKTGGIEFLSQTYYHSLASLYDEKEEFISQIKKHQQIIKKFFNFNPTIFENTELIYNNKIAQIIENMGYKGIYAEGVERHLQEKSPNHLYKLKGSNDFSILLRNYKLTDDIGFRFSSKAWKEWPLTSEKYVKWLSETLGDCINIFLDYETFGEHHWPETGVQQFLKEVVIKILKNKRIEMATPSETVVKNTPTDYLDIPPSESAISWADLERNTTSWLGNPMQWAYHHTLKNLEPLVKESADQDFLRIWRCFQTSDHLYYMADLVGGPMEVHTYFSPFRSPIDAYLTAQAEITDFENRIKLSTIAANEPFLFNENFSEDHFTGNVTYSLKGFTEILEKISIKTIEFHHRSNDFAQWAKYSLKDQKFAHQLREVKNSHLRGVNLRKKIIEISKKRYFELNQEISSSTGYF